MSNILSQKYLVNIIQQLSMVRTIDEITAIVRSAVRELVGADGATFVLREDDLCYYADEDAISPLWKGQRFLMEACISGWVMIHKQPTHINDIYKDPRIPIEAYQPTFVKSLTMVPIRTQNPIGAIGAYWATQHMASDEEADILSALADTASVAIENVGLYNSLNERIFELDNISRMKDEFLMTLSHELRTPMTTILGWSAMLNPTDAPQMLKVGLEAIERNAQIQTRVIEDLLGASQIISGKLELKRDLFSLNDAVTDALKAISLSAEAKKLRVKTYLKDVGFVLGDKDKMQQVVWNILSNSVKFTPEGGEISISLMREKKYSTTQS